MKNGIFSINEDCIGKSFTVYPVDYCENQNDGYYDVYGPDGTILYMLGESVLVQSVDAKRKRISLRNESNDYGSEEFEISFEQFEHDFAGSVLQRKAG